MALLRVDSVGKCARLEADETPPVRRRRSLARSSQIERESVPRGARRRFRFLSLAQAVLVN